MSGGETHSVKRHLDVDAESYDVQIRRFIPHYDEMIATGVEVLAVLAPFLILGTYQAYSRETVTKAKILDRMQNRSRTLLIRNARIFAGDGTVIESGGVLIKNGKIEQVYGSGTPDPGAVKADVLEDIVVDREVRNDLCGVGRVRCHSEGGD